MQREAAGVNPLHTEREPVDKGASQVRSSPHATFFSPEFLDFVVHQDVAEGPVRLKSLIETFEAAIIRHALRKTGWNQRQAARLLGVKYTTLNHKVSKLGLLPPREEKGTGSEA
jgi:DNA-binding NtrC family response regulator